MLYSTKDLHNAFVKDGYSVNFQDKYVSSMGTRNHVLSRHHATQATIPASQFLSEIKAVVTSLQSPTEDSPEYLDYVWRLKRTENDRARQALTRAYQGVQ
jgi:hypothetical protein